MSRGNGEMLPKIQTLAAPRCTCHMPGPGRSLVTTTSSMACGIAREHKQQTAINKAAIRTQIAFQ
jgi:hypothetical protein